jgi:hypothetical protein
MGSIAVVTVTFAVPLTAMLVIGVLFVLSYAQALYKDWKS